jgi:hypothetical protein
MPTLSKEFRRQLENAVLRAREEAGRGAAAALDAFGVADAKPPGHLDEAGKALRRKLRAHGRQVGDVRRPDESQEVEHLVHECAYEHWHRMLFALFLAENGVLIEPESGLDVDLDFCEERARETKSDKWEVAAGFAERMLPGIFRPDDPVLQLRLPAESRNGLTILLASLPREVFMADDSLGWVYQFWQAKKKDEINKSDKKRGADEIPAVTQLFTEDYMVEFLLHNTLGAWWAGRLAAVNSNRFAAASCLTEEAARKACALPGVDWRYLRFVQKDGKWMPAAGTFEGWPKTVRQLRVLDPCMGSGHFPVFALVILVRMRMAEEGLSAADACVAVLLDNLFGLEIDPRCTQIAAFNLALAAWKLGGYQKELTLNLACSGLGLNTREVEWLAIAGHSEKLQRGMKQLYRLFQKAPVLGSLINPRSLGGDLLVAEFHDLQPLLTQALQREGAGEAAHELAVTAQGVVKAAEILAGQFTLVMTNVPYLGRGKQDEVLAEYCERVHPKAKADLAACFVERCLDFCSNGGSSAVLTPQNWLYLGPYKKVRGHALGSIEWDFVGWLGPKAFQTPMWDFNVVLVGLTRRPAAKAWEIAALDVSDEPTPSDKAAHLQSQDVSFLPQKKQLENPDSRVLFAQMNSVATLGEYAGSFKGLATGDLARFIFSVWEAPAVANGWECLQGSVSETTDYAGKDQMILWEDGKGTLFNYVAERLGGTGTGAWLRGEPAWSHVGIAVAQISSLKATIFSGDLFDESTAAIIPKDPRYLEAVWAYCSSEEFPLEVRKLDDSMKVPTLTLLKVPFDLAHWQRAAAEKYPNGLPKPFSSDPTQWIFNGHPRGSDHPLQVAVARLLGYRWPRQTGSSFFDCPTLNPDGLEKHADNDGVVCFSQARDEEPAATRLRALLADAYGKEWSHAMERKLIAASGSKAESLEEWLLNDFFAQHCDLFHSRPFVWHIWDGRRDGFNVLVNYHRLAGLKGDGHRTLETLTYAYLGDWIARQKDAMAHGEAGADDRLAAALELQGELKNIVSGEPPYDLFIRWKPLHRQPIGWNPDINDGVRLNIRPFMMVDLSRGKKGCGLFRARPGSSLKWDKDRGNEPSRPKEEFPWFWKWDGQSVDFAGKSEFDGNRWNDCNYTTAFKRAARERKAKT